MLFPGVTLSPQSLGEDVPLEDLQDHLNLVGSDPGLVSKEPPEDAVNVHRISAKLWRNRGKVLVLCGPEFQELCSFPLHSPALNLAHPYAEVDRNSGSLPREWTRRHVFSRDRVGRPEGKDFWMKLNERSFRVSRIRKLHRHLGTSGTWSEGLRILRDRAIVRRCYTTNVYGEERRLVEVQEEGKKEREEEDDFVREFCGILRPRPIPDGFDWNEFHFEGEPDNLRTVELFRNDLVRCTVLLVLGMPRIDELHLPVRKLIHQFPGTVIANSLPETPFVFPDARGKDGLPLSRFCIEMSADQFLVSLGCRFSEEVSNQALDVFCDPERGFLSTVNIRPRV